MKLQEAESAFARAQSQVDYASDLLDEARAQRWQRYEELCAQRYGLVEGAIIVLDPSYNRSPDDPKEALFDSIDSDYKSPTTSYRPTLFIRVKTKSGWSRARTRAYGEWKVKGHDDA